MCGIAGYFSKQQVAPSTIDRMLAALRQRGPDAQHVKSWDHNFQSVSGAGHNALLHTRLSIRDLRPIADQPMTNRNRDIWICYNGEVYGWEDDAQQLASQGFAFNTRSDTEFILNAYEAWGIETLLPKLRGMFALAILDLRSKVLHLVRDRLGLKPLIFYSTNHGFAFGSTVRSVLPFLPVSERSFSAEGLDAFLAHRYIPAPRTIFENIRRLENGHRLCLNLVSNKLEKHRYWQPKPIIGDWTATLDDAISLRTTSDRPVGLFLSGGVDSTVIAARLKALGYGNISTFTAGFPGSPFDESEEAATLASTLGMPNHRIVIEQNLTRDFPTLVRDLDEPFADPSAIPTWYLSRETVRQATVVLGGDGGDELFGGYKRYGQHIRSAWRRKVQTRFAMPKALELSSLRKLSAESSLLWEDAYALRFSGFAPWQRAALQPDHPNIQSQYWRYDHSPSLEPLEALLNIDFENYLPEYILRKADLCTMAHGLELRAPLLDHVFVQHVIGMDSALRFTTPPKRALLAAAPEAAEALLRKKRGFNPPLKQWLSSDLSGRIDELGPRLSNRSTGQLDANVVREVATRYRTGEEKFAEQLLQLLILDESLGQLGDIVVTGNG